MGKATITNVSRKMERRLTKNAQSVRQILETLASDPMKPEKEDQQWLNNERSVAKSFQRPNVRFLFLSLEVGEYHKNGDGRDAALGISHGSIDYSSSKFDQVQGMEAQGDQWTGATRLEKGRDILFGDRFL